MRKITLKLLTIPALVFFTTLVYAESRLGYVDAARLLEEAPQAEAASSYLKEEFSSRENELIEMQKELKRAEEALSRDGMIMSESERKKAEFDVLGKKRELRRKQEEFQEDINIRRNDEIAKLQKKIKGAIELVGKEGNYDLIFFEGISFANPALDITDKVLLRLKKQASGKQENNNR